MASALKLHLVALLAFVSREAAAVQQYPFVQQDASPVAFAQMPQQFPQEAPSSPQVLDYQMPQQIPQQLPQQQLLQQFQFGGVGAGDDQSGQLQALPVQDILGIMDSMGEQQRKAKVLQAQLIQSQSKERQLNSRVLAETYSNTKQKALLSDLQTQLAGLKKDTDDSHKHLAVEEEKNMKLKSKLSLARKTLQDWQKQVASANQRAQQAEVRETNALKAGELEDVALSQQEELLNKMRHEAAGQRMVNDAGPTRFHDRQPVADMRM